MEAEHIQADEGVVPGCGRSNVDAADLGGRINAQAFALGAQAVEQRHVEAVELDAGVKAVGKGFNDVGADEGLGAVQDDGDCDGSRDEPHQHSRTDPLEPAVPLPERSPNLFQKQPPACLHPPPRAGPVLSD